MFYSSFFTSLEGLEVLVSSGSVGAASNQPARVVRAVAHADRTGRPRVRGVEPGVDKTGATIPRAVEPPPIHAEAMPPRVVDKTDAMERAVVPVHSEAMERAVVPVHGEAMERTVDITEPMERVVPPVEMPDWLRVSKAVAR